MESIEKIQQLTQDVGSICTLIQQPNLKNEPHNLRCLQLLLRVCEPVHAQLGNFLGNVKQEYFGDDNQQPAPPAVEEKKEEAQKKSRKRRRDSEKQKCAAATLLESKLAHQNEKLFVPLKCTPAKLLHLDHDSFRKLLAKHGISSSAKLGSGGKQFEIDFLHCVKEGRAFKSKPRELSLRAIYPLITLRSGQKKWYSPDSPNPYESPNVRTPVARAFFSRVSKLDDHINYTSLSRILDKFPNEERQHGGFSTCNTNKHMSSGVQNDVSNVCGAWFMRCLAGGDCALIAMAVCDADANEWETLRKVPIVCPHGEKCVFVHALKKCDGFESVVTYSKFDYEQEFRKMFLEDLKSSSSSSTSSTSSSSSSDESDEQGCGV